jgi:hypothetical protein
MDSLRWGIARRACVQSRPATSESGSLAIERSSPFWLTARTPAQSVLPFRRSVDFLVIVFSLIAPCFSGGNQPPPLAAPSEDYSDDHILALADGEDSFLAVLKLSRWNFKHRPVPDSNRVLKVEYYEWRDWPCVSFRPTRTPQIIVAHIVYTDNGRIYRQWRPHTKTCLSMSFLG